MTKFFIAIGLIGCFLLHSFELSRAQTTDSTATMHTGDSRAIVTSGAYGVRFGVAHRGNLDGPKPVINPFYDVSVGNHLALCVELMLSYENFQTLDFFTFHEFHLDSYGFTLKLKRLFGEGEQLAGYAAIGPEFSALLTRVSIGIPLNAGIIYALGKCLALEAGAFVTPVVYLGQATGLFSGITIGLRFRDN